MYHTYHSNDLHAKRPSCKKKDDKKKQGNWHKTPAFAPYHPEDTLAWLHGQLVMDSVATIPKSALFLAYEKFCITSNFRQMTPNIFGKFMFHFFPSIQSCRPGQAGKQQTHYKGIAWRGSSSVGSSLLASSWKSSTTPPSDSSPQITPAHSCPSSPDYYLSSSQSSSEDESLASSSKQHNNNLSSAPTFTTTTTTTTTCTARFLPSLQQVFPNSFPFPQPPHESSSDFTTTLPPLSSLRSFYALHTDIGAFSVSSCLPQPHSHIKLPQRPPRKEFVEGLTDLQDQSPQVVDDDVPAKKNKSAWLTAILREKARKEYEFDLLEEALLECLNSLKAMCKENDVRLLTQGELYDCLERLQPMTLASSLWMYCEHLKRKDPKRAQTQYLMCLNAFHNQSKTEQEVLVTAHILGATSDLWLSLDCAERVIAYLLQEAAKANPNSLWAELKAQKLCAEFYLDCTELPNNTSRC